MKYVIVLEDGMADEPIEAIGGMTPLEYAKTPEMDRLAKMSELGMVQTIPEGMSPGSDTANLAVLGYNPKVYYTGRSPLEALSIGVSMTDTDVALRCNLVTLTEDEAVYEEKTIVDHSADEISTEDAAVLLEAVKSALETENYQFYKGTSYRHLLIWKHGRVAELTPPHDKLGQVIGAFLPQETDLREMMKKSYDILVNHPLNIERKKKGLHPANSIWFWGAGTRPALTSFKEKTGKDGVMISAVDLLKGIAVGAGMENIYVEGANGGLHTNYRGKAEAAVNALLNGRDFAYIHVEAPDEMGHQGSLEKKVQAIEFLDEKVIGTVTAGLDKAGEDYRLLVLPDHPTPVSVRTHTAEAVPYLLYDSRAPKNKLWHYNEREAKMSGQEVPEGYTLIEHLLYSGQTV